MSQTPRYIEIRDDLLARVCDGTYPPGATLPPEPELAETYGVSRPTLRQAIQLLADAGYVEKRRRRGTVVRRRKVEQRFMDTLMSYGADVGAQGAIPATQVLQARAQGATAEVAAALGLEENDPVMGLMRLRSMDGEPAVLLRTWVPAAAFPDLLSHDFEHESLYDVFAESGLPVETVRRVLEAVLPEPVEAGLLGIDEGQPCFLFKSVGRAKTGQAIEYSVALYRGDTNTFTVTLTTGD